MIIKYEMTDETKVFDNGIKYVLHRIKALSDFDVADGRHISAGDLGGWIEDYRNLEQEGAAWVGDEAMVFDRARVTNGALVCGNAIVHDMAHITICSIVYDFAEVACCEVTCLSTIKESATIYGDVCDESVVIVESKVSGNASIKGNAYICESSIAGNAVITDDAVVTESYVGGEAVIDCAANINYAHITSSNHYTYLHSFYHGLDVTFARCYAEPNDEIRILVGEDDLSCAAEEYVESEYQEVESGETAIRKCEVDILADALKLAKKRMMMGDKDER